MRYINSLPIKLTAWLMITCLVKAAGQPVTDAFHCSRELMRLKMVLQDTANVSFQAQYVISFNDATSKTIHYQYKLSGNKIHLEASDSTEFIQNNIYSLLIQHNRHKMTVDKPVDLFKYLLQANVTDPSFKSSFVSGIAIVDTGGYKKLSYSFKPASPYRQYDIIYNASTHRIHAIQYRFNMAGSGDTPGDSKMPYTVTISFSNYQTGTFTDNVFSTNGYFIQNQGIFNMVAPYTSYKLINSLNQ